MMKFYVYILYAEKNDKFYVGQSHDYIKRLKHHNSDNKNTFTSKYRPWKLVAVFEAGNDRGQAMKLEQYIKKQKSKNLLLQLINPDFKPTGKLAQLVRVPHMRD